MRAPSILLGMALLSGGVVLGRALPRQDAAQDDAMQATMPGPVHEEMARYAGEYTVASRFWMAPGTDPTETTGAAKLTPVLGGRFLLEEDSGSMMGMPYEGLKLWGYNNATQTFESAWVYSLSTGIMSLTGKASDDGETVDWNATYADAAGEQEMHIVTSYPDETSIVVRMNAPAPDGGEFTVLELTYTRAGR